MNALSALRCAICGCVLRSPLTQARGVCRFRACINEAIHRRILASREDRA